MESFWATLKTECFHDQIPLNLKQAQATLFDYIETFYNPVRLHSSLGYLSPIDNPVFRPPAQGGAANNPSKSNCARETDQQEPLELTWAGEVRGLIARKEPISWIE
jgi:hypothetical protein